MKKLNELLAHGGSILDAQKIQPSPPAGAETSLEMIMVFKAWVDKQLVAKGHPATQTHILDSFENGVYLNYLLDSVTEGGLVVKGFKARSFAPFLIEMPSHYS